MFECLEWHVDEDVRNIIYDSMGFNSFFYPIFAVKFYLLKFNRLLCVLHPQ